MKRLLFIAAVSAAFVLTPATADLIDINLGESGKTVVKPSASSPALVTSMDSDGGPGDEFNYEAAIIYDIGRPSTTEYFARIGCSLTFPEQSATADAIRHMARGQVTHRYHYCARTMREAMGFGLGDAHNWLALPQYGYQKRDPDIGARAGDILVWPFTFGSRNSQHIGIAVTTPDGLKLLSNLNGRIQLDDIEPGYRAFWHSEWMMAEGQGHNPVRG